MDNTDPYKTKFKEERLYMSTNQNLMQHMRELIDRIKAADVAYYRDDNPTMTDREYDLLRDRWRKGRQQACKGAAARCEDSDRTGI